MKTIKELLIILRDNEELFKDHHFDGLCNLSHRLYWVKEITGIEITLLLKYIKDNRPKKGKHFNWFKRNSPWYWRIYKWTPRKKWLDDEIKKLEL